MRKCRTLESAGVQSTPTHVIKELMNVSVSLSVSTLNQSHLICISTAVDSNWECVNGNGNVAGRELRNLTVTVYAPSSVVVVIRHSCMLVKTCASPVHYKLPLNGRGNRRNYVG